ncbi:tetratricopeptide repeat protein [Paraburkholderia azotifigens]|uniref:protein O-GlcNAc transferase n=1 Tax=Paraburkholderia azotifigens TaxID=2057004 RepID=A0A5C6VRS3_9BURK|nr:glycosyltransferase family 41 protein [Paraburkholderia azotifigens]TXC88182.1 tetratricopeptide repeat protein [Paraburkholderia azotifigens]
MDHANLLNTALAHHQAGRLAEAKAIYDEILRANPRHSDALHFLGLLACQIQQYEAGITLMRQSIEVLPNAIYHNNLGNALREHGQLKQSIDSYREAVTLKPDYAEAHNNLGNALREDRQPEAAMRSCAQALELRPGYAEAYNNLGNALKDLGETDSAVLAYRKAISFRQHYADAHNNLGNALTEQGKYDEAIASYHSAIALDPNRALIHNSLGTLHLARGELAEAAVSLQRSIDLDPNQPGVYNNLANTFRDAGESELAAEQYSKALQLAQTIVDSYQSGVANAVHGRSSEPRMSFAQACATLGNAWYGLGRYDEAIDCYQRAVALADDDAEVHHNLAVAYLKTERSDDALRYARKALERKDGSSRMHINLGDVLRSLGELEAAADSYRAAIERSPDADVAHTALLFCEASMSHQRVEAYLADAAYFGKRIAAGVRQFTHRRAPRGKRPLRIGFVSGDLRTHPVGIFTESVLSHIDPLRIELIAYPTNDVVDDTTHRLRPLFDAWTPLWKLSRDAAAQRIVDDGIDILLDMSGHTAFNRLPVFAMKPAPVQVTWLGFFASTGVEQIDYVLGDRYVLPPEEAHHFIEKPWHLPDGYLCMTPPKYDIDVGPLPMQANGYVTFGYLGKLAKMTDGVLDLWARVLQRVPESRLLIKAHELDRAHVVEATYARFAARGIAASRLLLEGGSRRKAYLETFNRVDIVLSPFPYPGGTTTAESLWMGVPVVAMKGDRFLGHIGESVLHSAGFGEWICVDQASYIDKVCELVSSIESLAKLRAGLREHVLASPMCDARRFAGNFEDALEGMWRAYEESAN